MKSITSFFKSRSFANRLSWRLVTILFIVMGAAIYIIYHFSWAVINTEAVSRYNDVVSTTNNEIETILSDVRMGTINNIAYMEDHLDAPDQLPGIMKRVVELNPHITCCNLYFIENYFPQKGRWCAPYARRFENDSIVAGDVGDNQHNYLAEKDFQEALTREKGFWTKPYFDCLDLKTPLTTFMIPIHDRSGKVVAVLSSDLSLTFLQSKLSELEGGLNIWTGGPNPSLKNLYSYCFIIDHDGTYISHPDTTRILKENYYDYAKQEADTLATHAGHIMTSGARGGYFGDPDHKLKIEGHTVHLFYAPLTEVGWSLGLIVPELTFNIVGYGFVGILLFLIIISLVVVFFASFYGIRRSVKPLKALALASEEVAKGNFNNPLPTIKSSDEIHLLRDSFEEMQHSLTQYMDQLQATTAQKATMESELNIAHNIQMSMLPKTFPPYPQRSDVDIYGLLTPAKAVGGDLFDFYIRDEQLFFCIGDVSGKGVPASLVMAVTRTLFRNVSAHTSEPAAIVRSINDAIVDGNDTGMFVTLFVGVLDLKTGRLRYCNGGHNPPLLIGDTVEEINGETNLVVGIMPDYEFTDEEKTLAHGTTIFLFTDGLNEAEDVTLAQFGDERLHAVAWSTITEHITRPADIVDHMNKAVHQFVGTAEQSDDLTMLAIRYF